MTAAVHDTRCCCLGEGPLWHPLTGQLFWFDILGRKLMTRTASGPRALEFEEMVSAAAWIDERHLLMASATGLWRTDLRDGSRRLVCALEEDNPVTRSNDGRADPWGGFWIGTMGIKAEPQAGAIYRYHEGRLQKLFADITIPNAICFAPDRSVAYFADTPTQRIMKVALDRDGWPDGAPQVFVDLSGEDLNPDGAVTDAEGRLWVAQWGASRVAAYDAGGGYVTALELPARQVTCPAFGGPDFSTLFVTSATEGLDQAFLAEAPQQGMTFALTGVARGLPEPKVLV